MKLYAVVVIYNMDIKMSPSLNTIIKFKDHPIDIIVCDNSDDINIIQKNKGWDKATYISMNGNKGISAAFNKAIKYIVDLSVDSLIFFLDQDTNINNALFTKAFEIMSHDSSINIVAPLVYDNVGLLSPCKSSFRGGKRIKKFEKVHKNSSFINSGLCIRGSVFKYLKFNKSLFLDLVDHYFFREYIEIFSINTIYVSNVVLYQEFSDSSTVEYKQRFSRYLIFIKDFRAYQLCMKTNKVLVELFLLIYSIKLSFKYHSLTFITSLNEIKKKDKF